MRSYLLSILLSRMHEGVPLRTRGLAAYIDMLQAGAPSSIAASTSPLATTAADPHRLTAVMQKVDTNTCSSAMLKRLFSAAANSSQDPQEQESEIVRLWKRTKGHPAAPNALFQVHGSSNCGCHGSTLTLSVAVFVCWHVSGIERGTAGRRSCRYIRAQNTPR